MAPPPQDGSLPPESTTARCQMLLPSKMEHAEGQRAPDMLLPAKMEHPADQRASGVPAWIHLAGTGEKTFVHRRNLALPLAREGVASIILESPFYGGYTHKP
ncbi:hypothetical protein T484DRAFT_1827984 [Baffinella frigidus]|nr:hypothetical protein T484DRAFT_1827984 [Cryptophyta sp. CCMP2293]